MKRKNIWLLACVGGLISVVVTVLLSLLGAKLIQTGALPIGSMTVTAMVILGLSAILGAMFAALAGKRKVLVLCLISATVYFLSVAILNGVLQKGSFCRIGETALIVYVSAVIVGLLSARKKRRYG